MSSHKRSFVGTHQAIEGKKNSPRHQERAEEARLRKRNEARARNLLKAYMHLDQAIQALSGVIQNTEEPFERDHAAHLAHNLGQNLNYFKTYLKDR